MKLYLSLPITGRNLRDVKVYAKRVKQKWVSMGYDVITPFEICDEKGLPYSQYMGRDIAALLECDGIIMCAEWFYSKGCRLEYSAAEIYKLKKFQDNTLYMGRTEK